MSEIAARMRLIQEDCKTDAVAVDRTSFTPQGVGTNFGNLYAMVFTLARAVELLAEREQEERKA